MASLYSILGQASRVLCVAAIAAIALSLSGIEPSTGQGMSPSDIKARLDREISGDGKILVAGDSHASLTASAVTGCASSVVDAGIHGATSAKFVGVLDALALASRLKAAYVMIGTNDVYRKRDISVAAFRENAERIVTRLSRAAERVIVVAVPPIAKAQADKFDAEKANAFSDVLRQVCRGRVNCDFTDPHAPYRISENSRNAAAQYMSPDGIHLSDYAALNKTLGICPSPTPTAGLE